MAKPHRLSYASPSDPLGKRIVIQTIEMLSGRRRIEKFYKQIMQDPGITDIWKAALEKLKIKLDYDPEALVKIPQEGPLILVANHPFGIVDGLVLAYLTSRRRTVFKVMVNEVLCRNPYMSEFLLPIDFSENKEALKTNLVSSQDALNTLKGGYALSLFPAGGVATSPKPWSKAEDLEWKRFVAKAVHQSGATVIPIFFFGQNSRLFQVASNFSVALRLALFLHEAKNKIGTRIKVRIGDPIPYESVRHIKDRQQLLDFLRNKTFSLAE